jgi:glycosyltransferase involved in cell wall biosynthesis
MHNPGGYLRKPRHLLPLLAARPRVVTLGPIHSATLPRWLPFRPVEIPLAVAPPFSAGALRRGTPPPPVAVFSSNPLRGLDWLLDLWAARIRPAVPAAELHLYTGAATYGDDARLQARAAPVLARAASLVSAGVRLREPLPRPALAERLREARAMLYRGAPGETFCLALAEAQAVGLPCVVTLLGAVAERVADGETGVVARGDDAFAEAAIRLLSDDAAWSAMHAAALARGPGPDWDAVAARFEELAA